MGRPFRLGRRVRRQQKQLTVEAAIAGLATFRGYPRARLAEIAGHARAVGVPRNSALARAGEPLPGLLVPLCGMLKGAERLAAYLDSLARPGEGPCSVKLPASKTVIASLLGMKKETLSRLLRELSAQRLIRVSGREIGILDRARLARTTPPPAAPG